MVRVLLIEDDEQVKLMLRERMEDAGLEVATASEGAAALALQAKSPFPLVITDLIMPGVEGIETIRRLKKDDPQVKVIAISGGGQAGPNDYLNIAKAIGADRVFSKPVNWSELHQAIRDLSMSQVS